MFKEYRFILSRFFVFLGDFVFARGSVVDYGSLQSNESCRFIHAVSPQLCVEMYHKILRLFAENSKNFVKKQDTADL
jgi:hypothetical protein